MPTKLGTGIANFADWLKATVGGHQQPTLGNFSAHPRMAGRVEPHYRKRRWDIAATGIGSGDTSATG